MEAGDLAAGGGSMEQIMAQQQAQQANEDRRASILDQILEPEAKSRLTRLSLVKKEFARAVEDSLITAATNGKLTSKITEPYLIKILEQMSGSGGGEEEEGGAGGGKKKKVIVQRRKYGGDEDDDEDNDDDFA